MLSKDIKENSNRIARILKEESINIDTRLRTVIRSIGDNLSAVLLSDAMEYLVAAFSKLVV